MDNKILKQTIHALEDELERFKVREADFRTIVDNSPDILYRTDLNGFVEYISPSVEKLAGYSVEEAIGMHMANEVYLYPEVREAFVAELKEFGEVKNFINQLKRKDGTIWWGSANAHFFKDENGDIAGVEGVVRDITVLKEKEEENERLITSLQEALAQVKQLSGLIPICSYCKNVRDDQGYWKQVEEYIHEHSDAKFSHGICEECMQIHYPNIKCKKK